MRIVVVLLWILWPLLVSLLRPNSLFAAASLIFVGCLASVSHVRVSVRWIFVFLYCFVVMYVSMWAIILGLFRLHPWVSMHYRFYFPCLFFTSFYFFNIVLMFELYYLRLVVHFVFSDSQFCAFKFRPEFDGALCGQWLLYNNHYYVLIGTLVCVSYLAAPLGLHRSSLWTVGGWS